MAMVGPAANRALLWLGMTAIMAACGCGSNRAPLGKVEGTVRYKGQPLAEGQILFDVAGARTAQGRIRDGAIVDVTSYATGDGAAVGLARIAVFATPPSVSLYTRSSQGPDEAPSATGTAPPAGGSSLIPVKYNDPETSGLTHEIGKGVNTLAIELSE